ncbi:MAG: hypothetical protein H6733_11350 [Alphaproteobacteria bacterium]|nr:hypothetical protein [Alphaproteobacteria bacterium]
MSRETVQIPPELRELLVFAWDLISGGFDDDMIVVGDDAIQTDHGRGGLVAEEGPARFTFFPPGKGEKWTIELTLDELEAAGSGATSIAVVKGAMGSDDQDDDDDFDDAFGDEGDDDDDMNGDTAAMLMRLAKAMQAAPPAEPDEPEARTLLAEVRTRGWIELLPDGDVADLSEVTEQIVAGRGSAESKVKALMKAWFNHDAVDDVYVSDDDLVALVDQW